MRQQFEVWKKGKLISSTEIDDGRPDIADIDARLKNIEARQIAIPVTAAPSQQTLPPQAAQRIGLLDRMLRAVGI